MEGLGVSPDSVRAALGRVAAANPRASPGQAASRVAGGGNTPTLDSFGRDLTALARQENWIRGSAVRRLSVIQILSRRTQEQPDFNQRA